MVNTEITRSMLVDAIVSRLERDRESLAEQYRLPHSVSTFLVDDLFPEEVATKIHAAFPDPSTLVLRSSLRERKYVGVQMDAYNPVVADALFAFQDLRVVKAVQAITGIDQLLPDEHLYAGGISMMGEGHFLMPHLDNSHDKDRQLYRVLNLLYYVSPDWNQEYGGNLELWDNGPKGVRRTIHSRFNRLAVMVTHKRSWHSVSRVVHPGVRCCISNYYFSPVPADGHGEFHVTTFRAYPGQTLRDAVLVGDNALRSGVRRISPKQTTFQTYDGPKDN